MTLKSEDLKIMLDGPDDGTGEVSKRSSLGWNEQRFNVSYR